MGFKEIFLFFAPFDRIRLMTKEQLLFLIETKKEHEFVYNGKTYNLTYDKDTANNTVIVFGELYQGKRYSSSGELLNTAKIENHFFKDMLEIF